MTNRRNPIQYAKALLSLLLVLVSVAAPVIAETYVCPMAKAAKGSAPSCCAQAAMSATAQPGEPVWGRDCDCPKISWDAGVSDQTRQTSNSGLWEASSVVLSAVPPAAFLSQVSASAFPATIQHGPARSLWLEHQSIRC